MSPATPPQDASTSITSLTPYALKTTSVPTSAKIYQVIPLNEDLHSELEGSIINKLNVTHASHFVLNFYVSLKKLQPGFEIPDMIRLKQLYNPQLHCWQPIHLPHILRHATTTHDQGQGSSETSGGHILQPEPIQSSQKWPQTRVLTIQCMVEGPNNNFVIETEQGTYLPRASLEEKRTAIWLNSIVATLHSLWLKSKTILPDMGCQWSRELATKLAPSEVDLKIKPDAALLMHNPFDPKGRSSWCNVVAFLELSSSQDFSPVAKQLARKAFTVFAVQPGHHFVLALSILHRRFYLHCFNHVSCINSCDYSIHCHTCYFIRILYVLAFGPRELVSYDPTISFLLIISRKNQLHPYPSPTIKIGDDMYIIICLLFNSEQIRGRATLCFIVVKEDDLTNWQYIVKCLWTRKGRSTTEEQMLKQIQERGLEYGVPTLVKAWRVQIRGVDDLTALCRPDYLLKHLSKDEKQEI
ncbi:hypothetical protein JVU11DRAFT_11935 [Chiua virens]|nr:hypothetical protein JVU11DRAFT_11935 [Chiua virens]